MEVSREEEWGWEPEPECRPMEIKLVHVTTDLEADPVLGPSDPRPIEGIVRDIVSLFRDNKSYNQARDRRFAVEILACFQARIAMAQHPDRFGGHMYEAGYEQMLDLCVQHLVHCDCPAQETVQLQVTVQTALYRSTTTYVKTRIKNKETLDSIMGFIVDVKAGDIRKLFETVELLHGLMMEYLVELSRQIDTDEVVADLRNGEVLEALESVLPKKVLLYWMDLPQEEKILQMEELADVVIGIRVFNKCMQRGGEQFILPYTKYQTESDNLRKRVQDTSKLVDSRVANCILGIRAHVGEFGLGHLFIVRLRDELTYFMQAAVYLKSLDNFIVERLNEVINVREYCAHCVNRIVGTIGHRKNIPAELVSSYAVNA
ncbi:hypothetical protein Mapa_003959 [Marchantia paleacea]|nr:hypothetical protein Mapa_003959 [Marchantia paleacea]